MLPHTPQVAVPKAMKPVARRKFVLLKPSRWVDPERGTMTAGAMRIIDLPATVAEVALIRFGVPPALPGGPKSLTIPGVWTWARHQ
jgi:hypothetical protein